jgi:multisubunit Na+/H+ antiporter MnhG subunit
MLNPVTAAAFANAALIDDAPEASANCPERWKRLRRDALD